MVPWWQPRTAVAVPEWFKWSSDFIGILGDMSSFISSFFVYTYFMSFLRAPIVAKGVLRTVFMILTHNAERRNGGWFMGWSHGLSHEVGIPLQEKVCLPCRCRGVQRYEPDSCWSLCGRSEKPQCYCSAFSTHIANMCLEPSRDLNHIYSCCKHRRKPHWRHMGDVNTIWVFHIMDLHDSHKIPQVDS